ncbi:restriction endonuclease subunit S [Gloeocapsopsis dulcis]|uniref:restriction endonuclease subunit S n=1 Tax=Gloeocapsopsis dulcis TaxID=2859516 RepID=UPI0018C6616A|nr:restriction endonuclease subunit S [Gloeocapsopsis dulcis]WNN88088.1 restriction endonuclease subunit S [Gloeocapsopsis dulcis]
MKEISLIPEGWNVQKLGEIAKLKSDGTPNREKTEYWNNGSIPWVKTTEVNYNLIQEKEKHITQEGLDNSSAKIFPKGTLLMAMYGQEITRGRVAILLDTTLDDLDPEAIVAYRRERLALNPNASELNYNDQDLLYCFNAIARHPNQKGEYCPTIAGLILFGKAIALRRYFPMHRIDYILVEGKEWVSDPDKRYQSIEIREPLLLAIPKLTTLVLNDLPKAFNLAENGIHRRETPLIPRKVIREAIVNAL